MLIFVQDVMLKNSAGLNLQGARVFTPVDLGALNSEMATGQPLLIFCSIQVAKLIELFYPNLRKGVLFSNFHSSVFKETEFNVNWFSSLIPTDYLLNPFPEYTTIQRVVKAAESREAKFVRPVSGLKPFAGFSTLNLKRDLSAIQQTEYLDGKELIAVSPIFTIKQEYRFWIVDGKICESSSYDPISRETPYTKPPDEATDFAREVAAHLELDGVLHYTLDVAELPFKQFKVVEINAISTSGFYGAVNPLTITAECAKLYDMNLKEILDE